MLHESVQRLAHEQLWNSEARLFPHVPLHAVAKNRRFSRRHLQVWVPPALEHCTRRLGGKRSRRINHLKLVAPPACDLRDFLFQCHARKQIGNAVLDCEVRILVRRSRLLNRGLLLGSSDVAESDREHNKLQERSSAYVWHGQVGPLFSEWESCFEVRKYRPCGSVRARCR